MRVGTVVDIMVPFNNLPILNPLFKKYKLMVYVIIDDVERQVANKKIFLSKLTEFRLIIQREGKFENQFGRSNIHSDFGRRLADDSSTKNEIQFDLHHYNSYSQMIVWMRALVKTCFFLQLINPIEFVFIIYTYIYNN